MGTKTTKRLSSATKATVGGFWHTDISKQETCDDKTRHFFESMITILVLSNCLTFFWMGRNQRIIVIIIQHTPPLLSTTLAGKVEVSRL